MNNGFVCPRCAGALVGDAASIRCLSCSSIFPVEHGVADFFISESDEEIVDERNAIWEDPEIIHIRNTHYDFCYRELKGVRFCLDRLNKLEKGGLRILEVGTGTGHFAKLMDERLRRSEIYSFDSSWGILKKARLHTARADRIILFRANSRSGLPFPKQWFDVIFDRLAPLGAHHVPVLIAGKELLKPVGLYMQIGAYPVAFDTPPVEWAKHCGYRQAEYHVWQYPREKLWEEYCASIPEGKFLREDLSLDEAKALYKEMLSERRSETVTVDAYESALFAFL